MGCLGCPGMGLVSLGVFVRQKRNASGKISVQVIDKSSGKYRVIQTIGSSSDPSLVSELVKRANQWIENRHGNLQIDFSDDVRLSKAVLDGVEGFKQIGLDLLLGKVFDQIGFNRIPDPYFRYLVIYRLAYPKSKLKTTEYLYRHHQLDWSEDQLYRYLDKLYATQADLVQRISYEHTRKILGESISIVFYDVTTIYFEIDQEDELRKTGFSKEGKHQNPQIVLGLLVGKGGYPLTYDIFEGNKFEGQTMLPVIQAFQKKHHLNELVIIADSGLLSQANIEQLQKERHQFILGARIKNESLNIKEKILELSLENGQHAVINKGDLRLIVTFSEYRARKDLRNREKGLERLKKQLSKGRLTKANINKRGYNKYLKLEGDMSVTIDEEKFDLDAGWDGLKGYLTNADLTTEEILENYGQLWQIEKAFRVSKTDLKIRPIYHRLQRRIEAHICITFAAYKIYKEIDRLLKKKESKLSPEKAIEIAKSIFEIQLKSPSTKTPIKKTLLVNAEQNYLAQLFEF